MEKLRALMTNNTDDWKTPKDIYDYFMNEIHCIDPCPFKSDVDNINNVYEDSNIFINPPYSKIKDWVNFIKRNLEHDNRIFLLIPARTDTKYFHELMKMVNKHVDIYLYFIKGRLKFNDVNTSAPFPSVLIEMNKCNFSVSKISTYFIEQKEIFEYIYEV